MSARLVRTSLLAAALSALIAVPVALASGNHAGHGRMPMPLPPGAGAGLATEAAAPLRGGLQALTGQSAEQGSGQRDADRGPNRGGARPGPVPASFAVVCGFAREAMDDPIVYPGQAGKSHDHTFVGNRGTNADSTTASLLVGGTTCDDRADRSAYWMPTLLVAGKAVLPWGARATYRRSVAGTVVPFPDGLRMIAGDSHAQAAQPLSVVAWTCGSETAGATPAQTPQACPDAERNSLRLRVTFPSCWDGASLDSADHKQHLAYPVAGACPVGHAVAVPELTLVFAYSTAGGSDVVLASGSAFTGHADFMNAWLPGTLGREVGRWLNGIRGGRLDGPQGPPPPPRDGRGPNGQGGPNGQSPQAGPPPPARA